MRRSCISWHSPVLGDVFLTPAGQNASKERLHVPGTGTVQHILCRVLLSSVLISSHRLCGPHLLPVGLVALSSNLH